MQLFSLSANLLTINNARLRCIGYQSDDVIKHIFSIFIF